MDALVHDLRSPLQALCALLELLESDLGGVVGAESRADLEGALAAARSLADLVGAAADVRKAESGELAPEVVPCDLVALVRRVVEAAAPLVGDRAVSLASAEPGVVALADPRLTSRVVRELLADGLASTPARGTLVIDVGVTDGAARVAFTHPGPAARPERRRGPGGLALVFCRVAVRAQGGDLGFEGHDPGGGTSWLTLPRPPG